MHRTIGCRHLDPGAGSGFHQMGRSTQGEGRLSARILVEMISKVYPELELQTLTEQAFIFRWF
jgi:hypothetical protein